VCCFTRSCVHRMKINIGSSKTSKAHETRFCSPDISSSGNTPSALFSIVPLCSFCKYLDISFSVPEQFRLYKHTSPSRACGLTKLVTIHLPLLEFSLFPDSEYAHHYWFFTHVQLCTVISEQSTSTELILEFKNNCCIRIPSISEGKKAFLRVKFPCRDSVI